MQIYIRGMGNISPQHTLGENGLLSNPLSHAGDKLTCVEPDYGQYIELKYLRRMSRIIKMGVASATVALREAGISKPDGIITATGYGCLDDTGIFLNKMTELNEQALNPTPFIQSTHNTIGSQIALLLQCQGYNQTYTQGGFSFENALLDAMLLLTDDPQKLLLAGGVDETTQLSHQIRSRFGVFRNNLADSLLLFQEPGAGTVEGEGSVFFVLSGEKGSGAVAAVTGITTLYKPGPGELKTAVHDLVAKGAAGHVDLVLSGASGDKENDAYLMEITNELFKDTVGKFKHLCGEYPVASAFGSWLAAKILQHQQVPDVVLPSNNLRSLKHILVINQYFGKQYTLILFQAC